LGTSERERYARAANERGEAYSIDEVTGTMRAARSAGTLSEIGNPPEGTEYPMVVANNPFRGLSPDDIYALLIDHNNDLPVWPSEQVQRNYNQMMGPAAVRKTQRFIDILDEDGAFIPGWRGLDYGAGWGRIAALLLAKGSPQQLDLVDAWDRSLRLLEEGRFKNRCWKVSEVLEPGEIPENTYNFVYAFSVFTHLSPTAFWTNMQALRRSIKSPGTVYFTVRHLEFVEHKYPDRIDEVSAAIESEGFWWTPTQGNLGVEAVFGDTVVSERRLRETLGTVDYLGHPPRQMQHVYALRA
jgi:hypothetical protein